jgi:hypothetical protein
MNNAKLRRPIEMLNVGIGKIENQGQANSASVRSLSASQQILYMIGPFIPEHLLKSKLEEQNEQEEQQKEVPVADPNDEEDDIDAYAPELPPDMLQPAPAAESAPKRRRAPLGPSLPSGPVKRYDDDEDDVIGPVLPGGILQVSVATDHSAYHIQ